MTDKITPKQEKFALALMTYNTVEEARKSVGVSRTTVSKWKRDIKFRRYFRNLRLSTMEQTTARLQAVSLDAVEVLYDLMMDESVSPFVRQQSAKSILDTAYKAHETEDILEIVEEIREELTDEQTRDY